MTPEKPSQNSERRASKLPPELVKALATPAKEHTPPAHEVEQARRLELLRKVRITRDHILTNRGRIDGMKADKVYVWINRNLERTTFYESLGYVICKDPDIKSSWRQEDGTHRRGDLILFEVDKEWYEAIRYDEEIRALELAEGPRAEFAEWAARSGIRTFAPGE